MQFEKVHHQETVDLARQPHSGPIKDKVFTSGDPFRSAFYGTRMAMAISNPNLPDNPIAFANPSFLAMTGYTLGEVIGRNCRFLQGPDTDEKVIYRMRESIAAQQSVNVEILNYRKDGTTFWNALHVSPVFDIAGKLQYFFGSQIDVTDKHEEREISSREKSAIQHAVSERTKELQQALLEKTTLLQEMDHRVKNNLAMMRSLVRVQDRQIVDPLARERMDTLSRQLDSVTLTHQRLYMAHNSGRIDIGQFAHELIGDILKSFGRPDIKLEARVENIVVSGSVATSAALILNEIVTNACKYAFGGDRSPVLTLQAWKEFGAGKIKISDNGSGFDVNARRSSSMGSAITQKLAKQIRWTVETSTSSAGTNVLLSFEAENE
jgi:PAS domain S-box-containing protein